MNLNERVADALVSDTDLLTPDNDGTPSWYTIEADNLPSLVALIRGLLARDDG